MNSFKSRVLVCDNDPLIHWSVKKALEPEIEVISKSSIQETVDYFLAHTVDLLLLDIDLGNENGLQSIKRLKDLDPELTIVIFSQFDDLSTIRKSIREGADDYLVKSLDPTEWRHTVDLFLQKQRLKKKNQQQSHEISSSQSGFSLVGNSQPILKLNELLSRLRKNQHQANILIQGETGTGKEIVARQLRRKSTSGEWEPFVSVDSSTIQGSMAESLLFGHEKGAFTGAHQQQRGLFEQANGGTLYFDEIGNMPLEIQAKLLRVIQEKEVRRLGGQKVIPLEFRIICATNCNLEKAIEQGEFKEDLFQRIGVIPLRVPPLRERKEDIPLLVEYFSQKFPSPTGRLVFPPETLERLEIYRWPGNVRELSNLICYLSSTCRSPRVEPTDLPPFLGTQTAQANKETLPLTVISSGQTYYERLKDMERALLFKEFKAHSGNISAMARALQMDRSHLHNKLKQFDYRTWKIEDPSK